MIKRRHFKHKDYWCDDKGNIYCDKTYEVARGILVNYNKMVASRGYWTPKISIDKDGYMKFMPDSKNYRVARFVYECFSGEKIPETMHVDHIDGVKENNHISNLRVCTCKENNGNEHRRRKVSMALMLSTEDYFSTPKTRSHIKRDMKKRGISMERVTEEFEVKGHYPKKYMYSLK